MRKEAEQIKEKLNRAIIMRTPLRLSRDDAASRKEIVKKREEVQKSIRPLAVSNGTIKNCLDFPGEERKIIFGDAPEVSVSPNELGMIEEDDLSPEQRVLARKKQAELARNRLIEEPHLTFDDLLPYRIRVAWRLVREMARVRTLLQPDESLMEALEPWEGNPDPWTQPVSWQAPRNIDAFGPMPPRMVELILESEQLEPELCYSRFNLEWIEGAPERIFYSGLGLLPPSVPVCMRDEQGNPKEEYSPEFDPALLQYISLLKSCAEGLHIWQGSKLDKDEGRYGLQGMLDPMTCRLVFPSRLEIMVWEQMLTEETLNKMIDVGTPQTIATLKDRYGLLRRESVGLIKMARVQATVGADADAEEDRSVMILRLEDVIGRSRDSLDLRAEMQALKQLCIVQGLGRTDPNDALSDFIAMAREVSEDRDRKNALAAQDRAILPAAEES